MSNQQLKFSSNLIKKDSNDLKKKFELKYCSQHGEQITKICLEAKCLNNWTNSLVCEQCYDQHKKIHPDFNDYILYHDAIPNNFEDRIESYLKSQTIFPVTDLIKTVDEIYDGYQKYITHKVNESRIAVKKSIHKHWSSQKIIDDIRKISRNVRNDREQIMEYKGEISQKMPKYCWSMKGYINDYYEKIKTVRKLVDIERALREKIEAQKVEFDSSLNNFHESLKSDQIETFENLKKVKVEKIKNFSFNGLKNIFTLVLSFVLYSLISYFFWKIPELIGLIQMNR